MVLRLNGLEAGYGAKTVISDVSFALEPGQILAFLGHNGAGKTTTLKSIMGMLRPSAGEVLFDGNRIDRLSVAERVALGLRLLPEGRGIFPDLTVAREHRCRRRPQCRRRRDVRYRGRLQAVPCPARSAAPRGQAA